nr:type IV secretion system protein [uncultured Rhodopila sp.]
MAAEFFAGLAADWDPAIVAGVTRTVENVIQANAVQLASAISLWITLSGIATMFSRMSYQEWAYGAARAAFLGILLTAAGFSTWIQTPMMTTLPNWIATTVSGGAAVTDVQQFDKIKDDLALREATVLQQTSSWTPNGIADRLRMQWASAVACYMLIGVFWAWEMTKSLMGVLVATTPFVLWLAMFQATRHIAYNMGGAMAALLLYDVMISVVLSISMTVNNNYTAGLTGATDTNVDLQISAMQNIGQHIFFTLTAIVTLPALASMIGRGVVPGAGGVVRVPGNVLRALGRGVVRDIPQKRN